MTWHKSSKSCGFAESLLGVAASDAGLAPAAPAPPRARACLAGRSGRAGLAVPAALARRAASGCPVDHRPRPGPAADPLAPPAGLAVPGGGAVGPAAAGRLRADPAGLADVLKILGLEAESVALRTRQD